MEPQNMELPNWARIKVVGVGGGGCNALNRMIEAGLRGVEFVAVNTDAQALASSKAPTQVCIGPRLTKGLGVGGDPSLGSRAAEEALDDLNKVIAGADMLFIAAGMGGGTGTGAAPVVARLAKEQKMLTVGVVTRPFSFEGTKRRNNAEEGIAKLKEQVDTLLAIPNDRLLAIVGRQATLEEAFIVADEVLRQGIQAISELITVPGLINLDFADVRTIMGEGGAALMGIGYGEGEQKAITAAEQATTSALLDVTIDGARGVLLNITAGPEVSLFDVHEAAEVVRRKAHPDANIMFGAVVDDGMEDVMRVTVIATGVDAGIESPSQRRPATFTESPAKNEIPAPSQLRYPTAPRVAVRAAPADPLARAVGLDLPKFLAGS